MLQLRIGKDGRQIGQVKSVSRFRDSASSSTTEGPLCFPEMMVPIQRPPTEEKIENQPFAVRVNFGNVQNSVPPKSNDSKEIHIKKIGEGLQELRRNIIAYRCLEKDETRAKQNIYAWFHQAERLFLSSLNGNYKTQGQKTVEEHMEVSRARPFTPKQTHLTQPPPVLPNFYQQEAQALRVQVEAFRKASTEEMKKLEEITLLFTTLKAKYLDEKKANKTLNEAMDFYIEECDIILERILQKYQKEKAISLLEREVQQVLTKLKFKTFDYHYRP